MSLFERIDEVLARHGELARRLADPAIYKDPRLLREVSSEHSRLGEVVEAHRARARALEDAEQARAVLRDESDPELRETAREMAREAEAQLAGLEERLTALLLPRDPLDDRNAIMEIRAGAGGDEASIFAADLLRMYQAHCRDIGFSTEVVSLSENDEGVKEAVLGVSGDRVYFRLRHESGVHRVQRVPRTESQGRVHTSTVTVAVLPEADEIDFKLDMNEVKVDVFRASGAGGQHVNTTDSAVRLTHLPTGIVAANQDQKSQIKNREKAAKILAARVYDSILRERKAREDASRRGQVGTGDRSERIRTYNYPQNRLTDHRIGLTVHNLDAIMEGALKEVGDALIARRQALLLKGADGGKTSSEE